MTEPTPRGSWQAGKGERLLAGIVALAATAAVAFVTLSPSGKDGNRDENRAVTAEAAKGTTAPPRIPLPARPKPNSEPRPNQGVKPAASSEPASSPRTTSGTTHATARRHSTRATPAVAHRRARHQPSLHGYFVQAGAFREQQRAGALSRKLARGGWKTHILKKQRGKDALFAVLVGPWPDRKAAETAKRKLGKNAVARGFILRL